MSGCLSCPPQSITSCIVCFPGYSLTASFTCSACTPNCIKCTPFGCVDCDVGYFLNRNFSCQLDCLNPCATCSNTNPFNCTSCLLGYVLNSTTGQCLANVECNTGNRCQICPFGYILQTDNSNITATQNCIPCAISSNCARCSLTNLSQCLSCTDGLYLSKGVCIACQTSCAICINQMVCLKCQLGYVDAQSGLLDNTAYNNLNCTACQLPCSTCYSNPTTCLSCTAGYSLIGAACLSDFNFVVSCSFSVTLAIFQSNYVSLVSQLASVAGVTTNEVFILSVSSGSVNVNMQISSSYPAGS